MPPDPQVLDSMRRELALCCDAEGVITWLDPTAVRLLGADVGTPLRGCSPDETAGKIDALIERARSGAVDGWEACVHVLGRPATVAFSARPSGRGTCFVGTLAPEDFSQVLTRVNDTMGELAALHREAERQQRELQRRNEDLVRLNRELDDSARGMLALHAEIEEKADALRRMSEVKSRVVSNVSHEFRTPLNAIISLSGMLLARTDGDVTSEQERQLTFIRRSAEDLTAMVDDMLDLSQIEAGKTSLRPGRFTVGSLFAALRGMFRAVHGGAGVELVFDETHASLELHTDEGKLSQILRNYLSNALKFTTAGTVTVSAHPTDTERILFTVVDTGIGISPADQARLFDEFVQIDNPLQRQVKGTGLGLSLSRRLAQLLGGDVSVESRPGAGSTFGVLIPRVHEEVSDMEGLIDRSRVVDPTRSPILVLEDDRQTLFLYERYLRSAGFQILPARSAADAREILSRIRPAAIVLDVMLDGETSWPFLAELKASAGTRDIPVLVVTVVNRERKARALGADEFLVKPIDETSVLKKLNALARRRGDPLTRVLVADDDEVSRYMVKKVLEGSPYEVFEAHDGAEAVLMARARRPHVIFLDFLMPGLTAFDVIDELKADPATRDIAIIIHTGRVLDEDERGRLGGDAAAILPKESLNREVAIGRIRDALLNAGLGPGGHGAS